MGAREDLAQLPTPALRTEYRANAVRSAVLARKPQSGPLTVERNGLTLVFDADPVLIRNRRGQVVGIDATVRAFRAGIEIKIDPHRVCMNPPLMVPDGTFTEVEEERHGVKRLVRRLNYREDPWQAYLDWLFENIEQHPNPAGWRTRGTVTTVYAGTADAGIESSSSNKDTAMDGGGGVSVNATATTNNWLGSAFSSPNYYIQAGYFPFDTSAITDTDTVSDAVFSLYGRTGNASRTFELRAWIYDFGATVTTADWRTTAQLAALTQVAHFPNSSAWSTSGYNDFTNDALPANVSLTGTTYIIVSDDLHETDTAPTVADDVEAYFADQAGTTNDPKLVVTHAAGGGGDPEGRLKGGKLIRGGLLRGGVLAA